MLVTYYDSYNVLSKVYSEGAFIKQALNGTQVEERNRPAITKICYGVLDKDITLEYILSKFCAKKPKLSIKILLKIGIYAIRYLNTAPHAVTDTLVSLCKKMGKGGVSGFVNAVLRNYIRIGIELPTGNKVKDLAIRYSCPEFIVKKLVNSYGLDTAIKILSYDKEDTFVRFKTGGEDYLKNLNISYGKTPFDELYSVTGFRLNEDFYEGLYTFQSIGSVAICSILSGGKNLLDCCSAPGGKAVLLSSKFDSVTACDIHEHRVELIKSYASRMGASNVNAIIKDASVFDGEFEYGFDGVLCDAPCSGTGVIKQNPDIKLNRTSDAVEELSSLQLEILNNVSRYVKKGGELVYSTCSILSDENDGVIEKFLSENKDFEVVNCQMKLPCVKTKFGMQFFPHISMGAGFYACKLKRL